MTTSVRVHVNGPYRATVVHTRPDGSVDETVVVEGNYGGSPNPSGEHYFVLHHGTNNQFTISETSIDAPAQADTAAVQQDPDAPAGSDAAGSGNETSL